MTSRSLVFGPTFGEMLHPQQIRPAVRQAALAALEADPLNPINLFNITWKNADGKVNYFVMPRALTGVDADIVVLYGKHFPTGSHKVGATYSVTMEKQLAGEVAPGEDTLVFPSTGNYGIGGAWVGPRMGYASLILLPELMSQERFDKIAAYGAKYIKTTGCESNVKEIYDKCKELAAASPRNKILNQFEVMGNYRFHYHVTGNSVLEAVAELAAEGVGNGAVAAFVSAPGSAGTIAAGDLIKQTHPACRLVGLEPVQCPTLFNNGYGGHDIQGIGDKHVTWIHNVLNMDAVMCIDDMDSKRGLQLLFEVRGRRFLAEELGIPEGTLEFLGDIFGISGICNVLGAIKTIKHYGFGAGDIVVTIATDAIDRYPSVMKAMAEAEGAMEKPRAAAVLKSVFHGVKLDWIQEGTRLNRDRWFNLKYYTWVEQQGKTVAELNAQRDPGWWAAHQGEVAEFDRDLRQARGF